MAMDPSLLSSSMSAWMLAAKATSMTWWMPPRGDCLHVGDQIGVVEQDFVRTCLPGDGFFGSCADGSYDARTCKAGQLDGGGADCSSGALHEKGAAAYGTGDVNGAVVRNAGNAEARALLGSNALG